MPLPSKNCLVCGNKSRLVKLGVPTCESCYKFFKRHHDDEARLKCKGEKRGECEIDLKNGRHCRHCRLKKCLRVGMEVPEEDRILCTVCGDKYYSRIYGVPACRPCIKFFEIWHVQGARKECKNNKACIIDINIGRRGCTYCRLQKCAQVGMKVQNVDSKLQEYLELLLKNSRKEPSDSEMEKVPSEDSEADSDSEKSKPSTSTPKIAEATGAPGAKKRKIQKPVKMSIDDSRQDDIDFNAAKDEPTETVKIEQETLESDVKVPQAPPPKYLTWNSAQILAWAKTFVTDPAHMDFLRTHQFTGFSIRKICRSDTDWERLKMPYNLFTLLEHHSHRLP